MFNLMVFSVFIISFLITIFLFYFDIKKKRTNGYAPFISFIVPTYNDATTVEQTIKSIYSSYDKDNFEIFIINDCSKDNTSDVLNNLKKDFDIQIITNKTNLGKSKSINQVFDKTKGKLIFIVDSDVLLSKKNINDLLLRLKDPSVGASSCRYKPRNKGFFPSMLELDYGMLSLIQTSHNFHSTLSMWGGCLAVKREAFVKVGLFSEHMFTEDMDLALKIGEAGWRVEESPIAVYTYVPSDIKTWYKQKVRWSAGLSQNIVKHFRSFARHPIAIFFMLTYCLLAVSFIFAAINNIIFIKNLYSLFEYFRDSGVSFFASAGILKVAFGWQILSVLGVYFLYPLFSLPYAIMNINDKSEIYKVLLIFPFSLVYFPIYMAANVHGFILGIKKSFILKEKDRAW